MADVVRKTKLNEDPLRALQNEIYCSGVSHYQSLSESFIMEFKYKVDLDMICEYQILSESVMRQNKDVILWKRGGGIQNTRNFKNHLYWKIHDYLHCEKILQHQKLSTQFIKNLVRVLKMKLVNQYLTLDEGAIAALKEHLDMKRFSDIKNFLIILF